MLAATGLNQASPASSCSSASAAAAHEAEPAAPPPATLPGRLPLMCKSMTVEQWEAHQHERATRPPRQPLTFQYPPGTIILRPDIKKAENSLPVGVSMGACGSSSSTSDHFQHNQQHIGILRPCFVLQACQLSGRRRLYVAHNPGHMLLSKSLSNMHLTLIRVSRLSLASRRAAGSV